MQILNSIPRYNPQPSTVQEARNYTEALSTMRQIDRFQLEVSRQNQLPVDLDSSQHGVALNGASLIVGSDTMFVTGTLSLENTEHGPGAPVGMQMETIRDGEHTQLSYARNDVRKIYQESRAGQTTKIVHYLETDTLSLFRD